MGPSSLLLSVLVCTIAIATSRYLRPYTHSFRLAPLPPVTIHRLQHLPQHPPQPLLQFPAHHLRLSSSPPGSASLQGRRPYQEDRLLCAPRIRLPSSDGNLSRSRDAGLFGVFDGHLGDDASDLAAISIKERFLHHVSHLFGEVGSDARFTPDAEPLGQLSYGSGCRFNSSTPGIPCGGELLEGALRQAISDVDSEATRRGLQSGSTACIALNVDGQILVANVGDSKALICSSCADAPHEDNSGDDQIMNRKQHGMRSKKSRNQMAKRNWKGARRGGFCAQELSDDHRPDRPDEKVRIEAFGGVVTIGSLSRVNGQLAVSRSIGDIDFKRYGVTSDPELSSWHNISTKDMFLVLASDGIFERMTPQDVCNVLHTVEIGQDIRTVKGGLEEEPLQGALPLPGLALTDTESKETSHKVDDLSLIPAINVANIDACFREGSTELETWSADYFATVFLRGTTGIAQIMAQILVEVAYRAGSMDNLSALVIPLKQLVSEYS